MNGVVANVWWKFSLIAFWSIAIVEMYFDVTKAKKELFE